MHVQCYADEIAKWVQEQMHSECVPLMVCACMYSVMQNFCMPIIKYSAPFDHPVITSRLRGKVHIYMIRSMVNLILQIILDNFSGCASYHILTRNAVQLLKTPEIYSSALHLKCQSTKESSKHGSSEGHNYYMEPVIFEKREDSRSGSRRGGGGLCSGRGIRTPPPP